MGRINLLSSEIYNRIAAGEVVERPASIVKELVENSVDSGADLIAVTVKNGGLYIKVADNGCGILPEDMPAAFLPHATSKVSALSDLDAIGTLGFRGEALTSIAAVAKVTMISRMPGSQIGYKVVYENGRLTFEGECGCVTGTSVTVENLFENVPARKKFLQRASSEEAEISSLITKLILAEYKKSIKYTLNDKIIYHTSGEGMEAAIYAVYGGEAVRNMTFISTSMSDITLEGYINKPYYTKHNRSFQTLIVNGRYVISEEISYSVYNCYKDYLMKRQYPAYILYLNLPLDMVDVNVHPNKKEIKFANLETVKKLICGAVSRSLLEQTRLPKELTEITVQPKKQVENIDSGRLNYAAAGIKTDFRPDKNQGVRETPSRFAGIMLGLKTAPVLSEKVNNPNENNDFSKGRGDAVKSPQETILPPLENEIAATVSGESVSDNASSWHAGTQQAMLLKDEIRIAGVLFDTYIMAQGGNNVYFIDQHAAHEKLIFDKLSNQIETGRIVSQTLLLPFIFEVSHTDDVLLREKLDDINALGFYISKLSGLGYSLSAVPAECSGLNISLFVSDMLSELKSKSLSRSELLKQGIMQAACKAAVKGESKLSEIEIKELIAEMNNRNVSLFCPHGRPIIVKLTKTDLEKWFKRKV